jgi:Tol biopolymer transport system component
MRTRLTGVLALTLLCVLALAASADAAFPGTNGKIAFMRNDCQPFAGCVFRIYTMNADGTNPTGLTNNLPFFAGFPAWSPDGTKIAFEGKREIYTMNADGTNQTRLTNNGALDSLPAWSPDGTKIAFMSDRDSTESDDNLEIYAMNADGTNQTRLTNDSAADTSPDWSPDGTKIAFVSDRDCGPQFCAVEIYTMSADGTNVTRLTNSPDSGPGIPVQNAAPHWSPDGTKFTFASNRDKNATSPFNVEIYTVNTDGTNLTRLTNDPLLDTSPAWSPDGTEIAFQTGRDGNSEIYAMNADGTNPTRLTNDPAFDAAPSWQPIPGPQRSDYKNAAQFCQADLDFLGEADFRQKYGTNGNGANAYGKCVSQNH